MGDPRRLLPHEVEILVARELRKAGLELSALQERGRTRLSRGGDDYAVELSAVVRLNDEDRRVLVECRNEGAPVGAEAVRALHARLGETEDAPRRLVPPSAPPGAPPAATPPPPRHAIMFSTSGYDAASAREARAHGIALLTVADGKVAFARSAWGMAGHPPAWVPEYMAEVVDVDATGELRHQLITAGQPRLILDRLERSPD